MLSRLPSFFTFIFWEEGFETLSTCAERPSVFSHAISICIKRVHAVNYVVCER